MNKAVRLTRELIRIDSTNPGAGEQNVAEFIKDYLAIPGIVITEDEVSDKRNNLVAEIETEQFGTEVPRLVLICHMDTVVAGKGWNRDPFGAEQEEGRIYGRGVGQRIEGDANDKLFFRPLKNRPRSLGANGRLTAIIRHIIGEY